MLLYDLNISRERKRERKRGRPSDDSNILERLIEKVEKSSFSFASLFDRVRRRAKRNSQSTGPLWWSNCVVPELSGFYRCFHIVHDAFSFFLAFAQPTRFLKLSDRFRARARADSPFLAPALNSLSLLQTHELSNFPCDGLQKMVDYSLEHRNPLD